MDVHSAIQSYQKLLEEPLLAPYKIGLIHGKMPFAERQSILKDFYQQQYHVTGGGIPGNITRVLGKYGADLDNIWTPHDPMLQLQEMGKVSDREAYEVWNMGTGMIVVSNEFSKIEKVMEKHGIQARIIGEVSKEPGVRLVSQGFFKPGKQLVYED